MQPVRLPKLVESDPRGPAILEYLAKSAAPIRPGSTMFASTAAFHSVETALRSALTAVRVVRGLDTAKKVLAAEEHGLQLAEEKSGARRGARVSRLLLVTDDGSDGFYRQVENLLKRHGPRILALRLDVDAARFGAALFGKENQTRLVMISHKEAVAAVLLGLAGTTGNGRSRA
jgi:hypothetical protein